MSVRSPAVAGMFYAAAPTALAADVRTYLAGAARPISAAARPKALIVPHAGYMYSGGIAAAAYARLAGCGDAIRRVVLLGPAHRVLVRGLAVPSVDAFVTPLGNVRVDRDAIASVLALPQVCESDAAHRLEHSLEVQLPFLQAVLGEFRVVPIAVGDARPADVAEVIERLWGGAETLLVISSDLSHYHRDAVAREMDATTAEAVMALSPTLAYEQACGATPINGFLLAARRHALRPELLDLRNSGDTSGDKSRVVGYASFAFDEVST